MDVVDSWSTIDKLEYLYSGDTVSHRKTYTWIDNQWELFASESYTYSNDGDIVEILLSDGDKFTLEYENGKGNAKLLWYAPTYLVYGRPALRNGSTTKSSRYIPYHERLNSIIAF
jgi:hypothetical protein